MVAYNRRAQGDDTEHMIPYGQQLIDDDDIQAVVDVLQSDWLTTGPKIQEFEKALADYVGAAHAAAVSSGTAALHCAMYSIGIGPGDEVILPPMTFAATANCVVYQGGTPVFADVDPNTLLIDPIKVEEKITDRTKAIISVDYAGQPCDYDRLRGIAEKYNLVLVADGCHALGAEYKGNKVGTLADLTVFSFHPVKHITTGEGGLVVTDDETIISKIRQFRNHGIETDFRQRETSGTWYYEMVDVGYNYRITDIQCALGVSQLRKLPQFINRRRQIASRYRKAFLSSDIEPLEIRSGVGHAWHLFAVKIAFNKLRLDRNAFFKNLRKDGIGVNVHYIPVHLHPFYRKHFSTHPGMCPISEKAYDQILSIPIHPRMTDDEVDYIIDRLKQHTSK